MGTKKISELTSGTLTDGDIVIGNEGGVTKGLTSATDIVQDTTPELGGNLVTGGFTVDGRDVDTDGTKLDTIETSATADQTDAEIKTAYENNADTNEFSDAEQTKLAGIETAADVTDETNVTASLDGATLAGVTVAVGDKVVIQDVDDSDNIKTVTTQAIADLHVETNTASSSVTLTNKTIDGAVAGTNTITNLPYDVAFNAGFSAISVKEDVVVQTYAELVMARSGEIVGEAGYADTAPTGAALILDIEKNGTTIYATKPQFAIAATALTAGTLKTDGTEDFVSGDRITFKITQIGSTEPGEGIRFTTKTEV
tara:strand:+ start:73 stop:1011 length:939 start_codon:yes stop_codon:yes gene_type:complete